MATHPQFGPPMTPAQYATEWITSAGNFAKSGEYAWMAAQLGSVTSVLEIGCGSGESTAALLTVCKSLTAIDNNDDLLEATEKRLVAAGRSVHRPSAADFPLQPSESAVRLVNANILDASAANMGADGTLDAIVVWLIGASPFVIAPALEKDITALERPDMAAYRLLVQQRALELGRRWLRPDGVVHLVDRSIVADWQRKDDARIDTAQQFQTMGADAYAVTKADVFLRRLTHLGGSSIQSIESARTFDGGVQVLSSVRMRKL